MDGYVSLRCQIQPRNSAKNQLFTGKEVQMHQPASVLDETGDWFRTGCSRFDRLVNFSDLPSPEGGVQRHYYLNH